MFALPVVRRPQRAAIKVLKYHWTTRYQNRLKAERSVDGPSEGSRRRRGEGFSALGFELEGAGVGSSGIGGDPQGWPSSGPVCWGRSGRADDSAREVHRLEDVTLEPGDDLVEFESGAVDDLSIDGG